MPASPHKSDKRFDVELTKAARAEGLTKEEITALLMQCHSNDEKLALDAYRDSYSGRWKVCPSVIPPWWERPNRPDCRMWLPEWAALHREGKPF